MVKKRKGSVQPEGSGKKLKGRDVAAAAAAASLGPKVNELQEGEWSQWDELPAVA